MRFPPRFATLLPATLFSIAAFATDPVAQIPAPLLFAEPTPQAPAPALAAEPVTKAPAPSIKAGPATKAPAPSLTRLLRKHNEKVAAIDLLDTLGFAHAKNDEISSRVLRPYAEYEPAGTLFFSAETNFGSRAIKETLLRELPSGTQAVVYVASESLIAPTEAWVHAAAPNASVHVVAFPGSGQQFWSRDALPIPVWTGPEESPALGLVDARYYHGYEPDRQVAEMFRAPLLEHPYYFEGGNFVTDAKGNCFIVHQHYARSIPDSVFQRTYGCASLTRLPFVAGIGHADERVKILSDTLAVTDTPSYVPLLQAKGYEVRLLPKLYPASRARTYVNSLLVNGTLYLPVFGHDSDAEAIRVYEEAGLRVVPIRSASLSDGGLGSIHCITMTYPPADFRP